MNIEKKFRKPVKLIPFRIYNRNVFIHRDYPRIHPDSDAYLDYWHTESRRIIKGFWGKDVDDMGQGGYRWMPPDLYFYANFSVIKVQRKGSNQEVLSAPDLRDVDWFIFYAFCCCEGFSGFTGDTERTCFRAIKKIEEDEYLSPSDIQMLEDNEDFLKKKDGTWKEYVDARDYLYMNFDKPLGDPLFQNPAKNLLLLSSRGIGKTYGAIAGSVLADFTRSGASTLEQYYNENSGTSILLGSVDEKYLKGMVDKFNTAYEYLRTDVGSYSNLGETFNGFFWKPTVGSLRSNKTLTTRVPIEGGGGYQGPAAAITVANYKTNSSAGASFRARRIFIDEVGLMENFADSHRENVASQKRDTKFGYTIYTGTGGNVKKIKEVKEAFYAPDAFDCLDYRDIFTGTNDKIGLFIPAYYRNSLFKDENGNTDIDKALEQELHERKQSKSTSAKAYRGYCTSYPIIPAEMFLSTESNIFPTDKAETRLSELEGGNKYKGLYTYVDIEYIDKARTVASYNVIPPERANPILRWGDERERSGKDLNGNFVIFEPPQEVEGTPYPPQYLAVYDGVASEGAGSSLCVVSVFKMWDWGSNIQYNIVAEWIGRYDKLDDNHEQAFKLAALYNCKLLPEINIADILRHARVTSRVSMLERKPSGVMDKVVIQKKSYDHGIYISPGMISTCETYLNQLLITVTSAKLELDNTVGVTMIEQCNSMRFLDEIIFYSKEGNYDYISTMFLVAIWVRQFIGQNSNVEERAKVEERLEELKTLTRTNLRSGVGFNY